MVSLFQFPAPYPGECLYSILCRFHERSGNRTDAASIQQLFDKRTSLRNTIYSPALIKNAGHWFEASNHLNQDFLRAEHTMLPYACSVGKCFPKQYKDEKGNPQIYYHFSRNIIHHSRKLRYCPICVQQQRNLYGEPYWQTLAQIEGVDVCPLHGEIYRTSIISTSDIAYHFYSAASVLSTHGTAEDIPDNLAMIEAHYDDCILVAKESNWLLYHKCLTRFSKDSLNCCIKSMKTFDHNFLKYHVEEYNLSQVLHLNMSGWSSENLPNIFLYCVEPYHYICFINFMFGSMDAFNKIAANELSAS